MMKSKAIVFTAANQVDLQQIEIPDPGPGEVLLEALYTLISPGTELRCLAGNQVGVVFPFIPGYSFTGRVIGRGAETTLEEGTLVYCGGTSKANIPLAWGGQTAHAVLDERAVYPLPEGLDPLLGSAAHVAGIAYRGVRLSQPKPHEKVAVIGLGLIGALAARLHAASGAEVIAADLSPFRTKAAQQAGLKAFTPDGNLAAAFQKLLPGGADVVVDATGHPAVLPQALSVARNKPWDDSAEPGPRLVVQGSYASDFSVPYDPAFQRELSLHVPRDTQPRDIRAVLDLMVRGKLSMDGIITEVRPPESAPETYAALRDPEVPLITVAFKWRDK
jgi:bacteriochlorophyllide a dehydrogenase